MDGNGIDPFSAGLWFFSSTRGWPAHWRADLVEESRGETYLSDSFSISDAILCSAFLIFPVFKLAEVTNFGSDLASGRILLKLINAVARA